MWARARADCSDRDAPTSRTFVDLSDRLAGRRVPIFDQYENHCRIDDVRPRNGGFSLGMRCFEFYDDYVAQRDGTRRVVSLVPRGGNLVINGQRYRRCVDPSRKPR